MANQTINVLNNRYGLDQGAADFINDLIYSVFFSESGPGVYNKVGGGADYKTMLQNPNDAKALTSIAYIGAGFSPDELLPIIQDQAAKLIASGAYSESVANAKVSLLLVENTRKGKAVTWKVELTPAEGAQQPLITATVTGAVVKSVRNS